MKRSLFITGGSGFVGSHLLRRIELGAYERVCCLGRARTDLIDHLAGRKKFEFITGDLNEANSYASALNGIDTVVHLAAATGKAAPRDYFRVNVNGTKTLIEQCERAGVSNFLFVSTIAVKFRDKAHYHYALSKEQAEEAVNRSTINHTIVRPALILGAEAELWRRLSEHAKAPVVLVFGDGKVKIQPIYIEDLIDCLLAIIAENEFRGHTLELGGPEAITFDDFFKRIHLTVHHKEPRVLHLPLGLILPILSCMEKILHSALPVSVGQLASFHNDGTIERNQLFDRQVAKMKSIGEMFELILH